MKLVCIDNTRGNSRHLDLGKVYNGKLSHFKGNNYFVVTSTVYSNPMHRIDILPYERDIWFCRGEYEKVFITLGEYRNSKLEAIGV